MRDIGDATNIETLEARMGGNEDVWNTFGWGGSIRSAYYKYGLATASDDGETSVKKHERKCAGRI